MKKFVSLLLGLFVSSAAYPSGNATIEALQEYLDFAEYSDGAILPEQISAAGTKQFYFIDTRNQNQYNSGHIDGAVNIEWRQILAHKEHIPGDKPVVLYCDTGLLSSKAHLVLRLAGFENVKVLQGGFINWTRFKIADVSREKLTE